jgi:hypothetical protein
MPAEDAAIGGGWSVIPGTEGVRYVYESGGEYDPDGDCDGKSWQTATNNLQAVMSDPVSDSFEIWVAGGTYYPVEVAGITNKANPASLSFIPRAGIKVYGGFAGTERAREKRDLGKIATYNETALCGYNEQKMEYYGRVINITGTHYGGANAAGGMEFDGLTFAYGLSSLGGGAYISGISGEAIIFKNCTFRDNFSNNWAGAVAVTNSEALFEECTIINNACYMEHVTSNPRNGGVSIGGCSIRLDGTGTVTIRNSKITANKATGAGYLPAPADFTGTLELDGVEISGNYSYSYAAGRIFGNDVTINRCTITGNYSYSTTTTFSNNENLRLSGNVTVKNSVIWGNGPREEDQYTTEGGTVNFFNSLVQYAPEGIGTDCLNGENQQANYPGFTKPLEPILAPFAGGDYRLRPNSPLRTAADDGGNIGAY